jgi:hypothetical protein
MLLVENNIKNPFNLVLYLYEKKNPEGKQP